MSELTTTVGAVLRNKAAGILSIAPDATVYHAIEIMAEKGVGALLVMADDTLVGIVSERDYVTRKNTVGECLRIITDSHIRHLPVAEDGKVVGVLSIGDLVNWVITEQQETIRHLQAYISG
jgi:CBS domain-containing protein